MKTNGNERVGHLPFFLTNDRLKDKNFDCAVISIGLDDDVFYDSKFFFVTEADVEKQNDFFPAQPF